MAKIAVKAKLDDVEVFQDIEQGTPEWLELRRGCCTASNFATIIASGKDGGESVTRRKLLHTMAGEILTGEVAGAVSQRSCGPWQSYGGWKARMVWSHASLLTWLSVGFIKQNDPSILGSSFAARCSPDCLIGSDGVFWKSRRCAPT